MIGPHPFEGDDPTDCERCHLPRRNLRSHPHPTLTPPTAGLARVSAAHPATSHAAAANALPRHGTIRSVILGHIATAAKGMTDDELEQVTGRTHQSVSAARNALVDLGWIEALVVDHQPVTRMTRTRNAATVWVATGEALQHITPITRQEHR